MTAEDGVYLQYMILKVKVEMGIESWLSAIIWALEPNSERFFRRITFGHRGLVSPDFFLFFVKERQAPLDNSLEMENNLVALDSCLCVNPQIKVVPGCSHKVCQSSSTLPIYSP